MLRYAPLLLLDLGEMSVEHNGSMFESFDLAKIFGILSTELNAWFETSIKSIPNLFFAFLVLVIAYFLAGLVRNLTESIFSRSTRSRAVLDLIKKILHLSVMLVGLFIALGILKLDKTVTSLLAGAGVVGLALGFAFQEIASNFVSGILIALQEPYRIGDIVHIGDFIGNVKRVELRCTTITTFDGQDVLVPNKRMYTEALTNYSITPRRRVDLNVGISYSEDLRKVEQVTKAAVEKIPGRIESEELRFYYKEFGDSSINFTLQVWVHYPANHNFLHFQHEAIVAIKQAFDANGITIPFPIRTLDMSPGLAESLAKKL
ncbi:MAG: mechanosensitive ion channel family protein [Bdellovibrionota bacterium]